MTSDTQHHVIPALTGRPGSATRTLSLYNQRPSLYRQHQTATVATYMEAKAVLATASSVYRQEIETHLAACSPDTLELHRQALTDHWSTPALWQTVLISTGLVMVLLSQSRLVGTGGIVGLGLLTALLTAFVVRRVQVQQIERRLHTLKAQSIQELAAHPEGQAPC